MQSLLIKSCWETDTTQGLAVPENGLLCTLKCLQQGSTMEIAASSILASHFEPSPASSSSAPSSPASSSPSPYTPKLLAMIRRTRSNLSLSSKTSTLP